MLGGPPFGHHFGFEQTADRARMARSGQALLLACAMSRTNPSIFSDRRNGRLRWTTRNGGTGRQYELHAFAGISCMRDTVLVSVMRPAAPVHGKARSSSSQAECDDARWLTEQSSDGTALHDVDRQV